MNPKKKINLTVTTVQEAVGLNSFGLWTFKQAETLNVILFTVLTFFSQLKKKRLILNFVVCVLSSRHVVVMISIIYFRKTYNDKQQKICNNVLIECKYKAFVLRAKSRESTALFFKS